MSQPIEVGDQVICISATGDWKGVIGTVTEIEDSGDYGRMTINYTPFSNQVFEIGMNIRIWITYWYRYMP